MNVMRHRKKMERGTEREEERELRDREYRDYE